ncbi:nucleotide exchange factor GrpE [bacterium]|nr:nucleotide exchange factor GrpE [bacterium]
MSSNKEDFVSKLHKKIKKVLTEKRNKIEIEQLSRTINELSDSFDIEAFLNENPNSQIMAEYDIREEDLPHLRELTLGRFKQYFDSFSGKYIFDSICLQISYEINKNYPDEVQKNKVKNSVIKESLVKLFDTFKDFDSEKVNNTMNSMLNSLIHDMYYFRKLEKLNKKLNTEYKTLLDASIKDKELLSTAQSGYNKIKNDYANLRKRTEKEKEDYRSKAEAELIGQLIEILDDFERAIGQLEGNQEVLSGFSMIENKLSAILKQRGLEKILSDGEEFDPEKHEAMMVEKRDDVNDNTITETIRSGFLLNEKLLRPSLVKVAQNNKDNKETDQD